MKMHKELASALFNILENKEEWRPGEVVLESAIEAAKADL